MQYDPEKHQKPENNRRWWRSRQALVFIVFLIFGGSYLLSEHTVHLYSVLPWLILLACPVLHFFMHRGHHHQHEKEHHKSKGQDNAGG